MAYFASPEDVLLLFLLSVAVVLSMKKPESSDDDVGREGFKKRAALSTDGDRLSVAARTGASSDTRCLKDISVPGLRVVEHKEVEVAHLVRARDLKEGAVLPLVWGKPDVMVYVKLGAQYLNARKFMALPSHGRSREKEKGGVGFQRMFREEVLVLCYGLQGLAPALKLVENCERTRGRRDEYVRATR